MSITAIQNLGKAMLEALEDIAMCYLKFGYSQDNARSAAHALIKHLLLDDDKKEVPPCFPEIYQEITSAYKVELGKAMLEALEDIAMCYLKFGYSQDNARSAAHALIKHLLLDDDKKEVPPCFPEIYQEITSAYKVEKVDDKIGYVPGKLGKKINSEVKVTGTAVNKHLEKLGLQFKGPELQSKEE